MSGVGDSPKKSRTKPPKEKKTQQSKVNEHERLKIVVRRLPPNLPEEVFWQSVQPWITDSTVSWKTFYSGKPRKRLNKENIPSRAYLLFKNEEDLAIFSREYDGHLFRDKAGNETQAVVEFSPYQKTPPEKAKADSRIATIESDEDYISFLESLKVEPKPFDEETLESLIASTRPPPEPKTTPLIEALIAEKSAQRDKEAILRNHAHYKDHGVLNGAGGKRDEKKKVPLTSPPPRPTGSEPGKRAAKRAASSQKQNKGSAQGAPPKNAPPALTTAPTIMSKSNPVGASAAAKAPPRPPRPQKIPTATGSNISGSSEDNSVVPVPTTVPAAIGPPSTGRKTRPVIGAASRHFEAALSGAGVKSKKSSREKEKDDTSHAGDSKMPSSTAQFKEGNTNVRTDAPAILSRDEDSHAAAPSNNSTRGSRGRGRGRGRGNHRGS